MFGKSKPPGGKAHLNDRIRSVTSAPHVTAPIAPYVPPSKQTARSARDPLFRNATLILSDTERFAVVIKNISASGARVEYFTNTELPPVVVLVESTMKLRVRARVVWQHDGVAGLEFIA